LIIQTQRESDSKRRCGCGVAAFTALGAIAVAAIVVPVVDVLR
jgi:hypothetical protein